ncbi:MAG: carbohydrate binding family 9 domain-containing protein, partial [Myxococcota bacterium]
LYIGVHAFDSSPDEIALSNMVRDANMSSGDRITISLDTYFDQRNGFHFEVNPLGNKRDGLIENGSESYEWDGIWYADARIDRTGYYVEIAIPYKTLSIARDQTTWGLQVVRFIKRNGEED